MKKRLRPYDAPKGFDWIADGHGWQIENNVLIVSLLTASKKEAAIVFRAEQPAVWRITFFPPRVPPEYREPVAARPVLTPLPLEIEKAAGGLLVRGADLVLEIRFRPWRMRFLDSAGKEVFSENPDYMDGLGRHFALPLGYVTRNGVIAQITTSFKLRPGERLYGLCEKPAALDKTGRRIVSWTEDSLGATSERSHINIPFLWSTCGYGVYIDSGARLSWDLGATSGMLATVRIEDRVLDAYLLSGKSPARILDHYASLTGRPPVPPKWTFGIWLSAGGANRTQEEVQKLASDLERSDLPIDVIHIGPWWMRERKCCDFQWDRKAFPRPELLIEVLHRFGLRLSLQEYPCISVESELYATGKEKGYFVRRPNGEVYNTDCGLSLAPKSDGPVRLARGKGSHSIRAAIVDFTNPEAVDWFKDLHRPLLRMGVDIFQTDFGEGIPADALFANGQTGMTMHNLYPLLYSRAVFEVTEEEKGYGAVWTRSAFAGSQQYPLVWSEEREADFQSLASTIGSGLSVGLAGLPFWSNDTRGFRRTPSPELYVRWAQFGLFCSHCRMPGETPRGPLNLDEEAASIVRKLALLRYELFPYIYSTAFEAGLKGLPVTRALPLAFPADPNSLDKDSEYMFGPWLLVAPVIEPGGNRDVYLPEGVWFDYWTGEAHEGPKNLRLHVPLDVLPLYVLAGAIIPRTQRCRRIPEERLDPLIIEVWPHGQSRFNLYEDEGVTEFGCDQGEDGISLEWSGPLTRRVILHFRGIKKPKTIVLTPCEKPEKTLELEGIVLDKKYVLAVPDTAGARVILRFLASSRWKSR